MIDPATLPSIGCVIPVCEAQDSISQVIESLLRQSRVPGVIHVVATGASDATARAASRYAGAHTPVTELGAQPTEVFVHHLNEDPEQKSGALNYGYALVEGHDFLLHVDGDTTAAADAVERLRADAVADRLIGVVSSVAATHGVATAPGGSFALYSMRALRDVMAQNRRTTPWPAGTGAQNAMRVQIERAGYAATINPFVHAMYAGHTPPMTVAFGERARKSWGDAGLGNR